MTKREAMQLPLGLYVLRWKDGSSSLAAVGMLVNGDRWFAPANWTSSTASACISTDWRTVKNVYRVEDPRVV